MNYIQILIINVKLKIHMIFLKLCKFQQYLACDKRKIQI